MNSIERSDGRTDEPAATGTPEPAEPEDTVVERSDQTDAPRTRMAGIWVGSIVAALVMVFLLIFVLQNLKSADIEFLAFEFSLPLGVAMLLAAVTGILMVAIPGIARILQLRRNVKARGALIPTQPDDPTAANKPSGRHLFRR